MSDPDLDGTSASPLPTRNAQVEETAMLALLRRRQENADADCGPLSILLWAHAVTLHSQRYLVERAPVPKAVQWANQVLPDLDLSRFRTWTRMSRGAFAFVLAQIEDNEVFRGGHRTESGRQRSPQAPVAFQLALALHKLGTDGTGSAIRVEAGQWGASEGHVFNCTRRVIRALASLAARWIQWPAGDERDRESSDAEQRAGLRGAIGKLDGTDIVLYERPAGTFNGEEFFNRKRRYAINLTAVCDRRLRFTYMLVGWPGSVHDSRAWSAAVPRQQPEHFFDEGQFLVADSAYANSRTLVTPYKKPLSLLLPNRRFNKLLSSIRIDVEHAFGALKGRWGSLRGLRIRLLKEEHMRAACSWITACVVLHNMMVAAQEAWEEAIVVEAEDEAGEVADEENLNEDWREIVKRRALLARHGMQL